MSSKPITRSGELRLMRAAPSFKWLSEFTTTPDYSPNWDAARSAAFLTILESARHTIKKRTPDLTAAAVLRHRHRLLRDNSNQKLFAALAFMSIKEASELATHHESNAQLLFLTQAEITALDPSQDDIEEQSTPDAKTVASISRPKVAIHKPAPAHQPRPWWG